MCVQKSIYRGGLSESYIQVSFLQSKKKLTVLVFFLQHVILCFVNQNFSFQCHFSMYISLCQPQWEAEITLGLATSQHLKAGLQLDSKKINPLSLQVTFGGRQTVKTVKEAGPQAKANLNKLSQLHKGFTPFRIYCYCFKPSL